MNCGTEGSAIGSWFCEWLKYCARYKAFSDAGVVIPECLIAPLDVNIWKKTGNLSLCHTGFHYDSFKKLTVSRIVMVLSAHQVLLDRKRVLDLIVSTGFPLQRRRSDIKSYKNICRGKSWKNWDMSAAGFPLRRRI